MKIIIIKLYRSFMLMERKELMMVPFLMIVIFAAGLFTFSRESSYATADSTANVQSSSVTSNDDTGGFADAAQELNANQKEKLVEQCLSQDVYGEQLRDMYQKYPDIYSLIVNRSEYPDWLIEYFLGHEEAVEWVLDYPGEMRQEAAVIAEEALKSIDLTEYEMQNGIPLYFQWDKRWGYASYGEGCIAVDGCGATTLSMVLCGILKDGYYTPKRVADFSAESGYFSKGEGTYWELMGSGARELGLDVSKVIFSRSAILQELRDGRVIIASMGPGDFTDQGHFIVLCGVNEDGQVIVNDPNSRVNSQKLWEAGYLLEQIKAMWSYTQAK